MDTPQVGEMGEAQKKCMVSIVRFPLHDPDLRERLRDVGIPTPDQPFAAFQDVPCRLRQERRSHFALDIRNLRRENEKRGLFLAAAEITEKLNSAEGHHTSRRLTLIFRQNKADVSCLMRNPSIQKALQDLLEIPVRGLQVSICHPENQPVIECLDVKQLCEDQVSERELYFDGGEWETRPRRAPRHDSMQSRAQASA